MWQRENENLCTETTRYAGRRNEMRFKRTWFRALLRRRIAVILLLALQILFICYVINSETVAAEIIRVLLRVASGFIALHVVCQKDKGAYKVAWISLTLLFPPVWQCALFALLFSIIHSSFPYSHRTDTAGYKIVVLSAGTGFRGSGSSRSYSLFNTETILTGLCRFSRL